MQEVRDDIVGGQATAALPAVGALTRFGSSFCTGTLIGPRRVLTAAHCLEGVAAGSIRFAIGPDARAPEASLPVASVTPHPNYNRFSLANDIAYVTLAQDAPVPPMGTLPQMDPSFVGQNFVHVGYGASNGFSQTGSGIKRFVTMPVRGVQATTFSYGEPGRNTCNGDSGGPAFAQVDGELLVAGVVSFGDATCSQFGVNTRVDAYADFLAISPQSDPCAGETFAGRCDGEVVVWCENQQVNSNDCAATNRVCTFSAENQIFACAAPPTDPCQGETFAGRCVGNTVVYCDGDGVQQLSCPGSCGFDSANGFFNCL
ncbi:MAG: trypsin-like serine protease [Myxococcota bacterium]